MTLNTPVILIYFVIIVKNHVIKLKKFIEKTALCINPIRQHIKVHVYKNKEFNKKVEVFQ